MRTTVPEARKRFIHGRGGLKGNQKVGRVQDVVCVLWSTKYSRPSAVSMRCQPGGRAAGGGRGTAGSGIAGWAGRGAAGRAYETGCGAGGAGCAKTDGALGVGNGGCAKTDGALGVGSFGVGASGSTQPMPP